MGLYRFAPVLAAALGAFAADTFTLDAAAREAVIRGAIAKLNEGYVFPEVAEKMERAVLERLSKGEYNQVTSGEEFARLLTEHFRAVSNDKHLGVRFSPRPIPPPPAARREPTTEERDQMRKQLARTNFGFEKVERLPGNIGLLDFRFFGPKELVAPTVTAAFHFLGSVDALIVDLRQNGGGSPETIAFITSYLYDGERVHLNDIWERKTGKTEEYWTQPNVPGARLGGKDVWVLTSSRTFSGAEEFSYNLKNLKRATIVGEVTGGGAHPVRGERIHDHFLIGVPFARAINPITKTNWEGTGVEPDVKVPREQALHVAHLAALNKLKAAAAPDQQAGFQKEIDRVEGELSALKKK